MHRLPIVGFPAKISVRIEILLYLLMAVVLLSVACLPEHEERNKGAAFSEKDAQK